MTAVRLYGLRLSSQCRVIPVPERITLERSESTCNAGLVEARLSPSSVSVSLGARPSGSLSLSLSLSFSPLRLVSIAPGQGSLSLRAEIVTRRDRYAPRSRESAREASEVEVVLDTSEVLQAGRRTSPIGLFLAPAISGLLLRSGGVLLLLTRPGCSRLGPVSVPIW